MSYIQNLFFKYVSDIVLLPLVQDIFDEVGAIITQNGLVWPITHEGGETLYYNINIQSKEVFLLPQLDSDDSEATRVSDEKTIAFLLTDIQGAIHTISLINKILRQPKETLYIGLGLGPHSFAILSTKN